MNALIRKISSITAVVSLLILSSCYDRDQKANELSTTRSRGVEYAPQMYHAEAYEPMSQVTDKSAGLEYWPFEEVGGGISDYDSVVGHGEWFNTNYYNPNGINMRHPVKGTVARGSAMYNYNIHADSLEQWSKLKSPLVDKKLTVEKGAEIYQRFCQHCHGEEGNGKGEVGIIYGGVPNYHTKAYRSRTVGSVYHTVTFGQGNMRPHASLLDPEERWQVSEYIKYWQAEVASSEE